MQMSNDEIISKFKKSDDKKSYLKILAELNGCDDETIKRILISGGIDVFAELGEKKKSGRPKKSEPPAQMPKYKTAAELLETPELTDNEQERLDRALAIPMSVRQACSDRMESLRIKIMELEKERDEICDFLNGEVANG